MDRLLLVDGSNLLFQMFFGMPARIVNGQGKAIQGTLGFVGALLKIIRRTEPTHVAVLFDGEHENDRAKADAGYKANRVDYSQVAEEESPFSQLRDIYAALDYLGVRYAETTVCETDDWMACYSLTYGKNMEIVISSFDSDFFQLITDKVSVLRYRGDRTVICTPSDIMTKFGIAPAQYADWKAMTGDKADNIRGVAKIGPKTAAALLNQYGSLDHILANAERIERPSVRAAITENAEKLKTNYQIIKLNNHAALPFSLDDMVYTLPPVTTNEVLKGIGLR